MALRRPGSAISAFTLESMIVVVLLLSVTASAATVVTWTTQADFQAGTLVHLDATSSPGQLRLANVASPWVKFSANPILGPGPGWEAGWVDLPSILFENGMYKMWYQGCVGNACSIGYATSTDGMSWTRFSGNPVFIPNATGWDQTLADPVVVHDGNLYRMWYAGNGPLAIQIGYATSPDGISWTRHGSAPAFMGREAWDRAATSTPVVVKVGLTWVLYFSGQSGDSVYKMGRATSPDGVNWTEDSGNPLMVPDAPWEATRVHPGVVLVGPSGYELFYTGNGLDYDQIGRATSVDGRVWSKDSANPVVTPGRSGAWDSAGVAGPKVVTVGGATRMYYGGTNGPLSWRIGVTSYAPESAPVTYATSGVFASAVVDSSSPYTTWDTVEWSGTVPADTGIGVSVRVGNTSTPDPSWSPLSTPVVSQGPATLHVIRARFVQVLAALVTFNVSKTPGLDSITLTYSAPGAGPQSVWFYSVAGIPLIVLLFVVPAAVVAVTLALVVIRQTKARPTDAAGPIRCSACGAINQAANRFCFQCGQPISGRPSQVSPPT